MTAREYLEDIGRMDRRVDVLLAQKSQLMAIATKSTTSFEGEVVDGTKHAQRMESTILKIIALEKKIDDQIDEMVDRTSEAQQFIGQLQDPNEQYVLTGYYLEHKTQGEIAEDLGYNIRTIRRLMTTALENFEKISKVVLECPTLS